MKNIIEINNLCKTYGKNTVVDDLSLTIKEGEVVGFLGPNGAGKTTTINAIISRITYTGDIKIFGKALEKLTLEERQKIGIVPQQPALFNELNVYENVKYFALLYGIDKSTVKSVVDEGIEFFGLKEHVKKKVSKLSGGQLTRLNILCGIIHKPKLLFLDEPTVAIDPQTRNLILNNIKKLANDGTTIVYTSHYMEEIEYLCNKIIIIDKGKTIAEGSKDDLHRMLGEKQVMSFVSYDDSSKIIEKLKQIENVSNVSSYSSNFELIFSGDSENIISKLDEICTYSNLNYGKPSLQTIFIELTGRDLRE